MESPFIMLILLAVPASIIASMLTVFIARRWLGLSLGSVLTEFGVASLAGVFQALVAPFILAGGLLGVFSIGLFPVWAVFSLAHRDRWDRFDGFKFSALQAVLLLLIGILLTTAAFYR